MTSLICHHDIGSHITTFITFRISAETKCTYRLDLVVYSTIITANELKNNEINHVHVTRNLESDSHVTISVAYHVPSNTNDTDWILVTIIEAAELKNI